MRPPHHDTPAPGGDYISLDDEFRAKVLMCIDQRLAIPASSGIKNMIVPGAKPNGNTARTYGGRGWRDRIQSLKMPSPLGCVGQSWRAIEN
jgi:hypothetical protein